MLRYYSYYSVGGYKDMFLGTSEDKDREVYYLPLLPVWKSRGEKSDDKALLEKVAAFSQLPAVKILTNKEMYGLPAEALPTFSHGGYKVLLKQCSTGEGVLTIRDLEGDEKDDAGRAIPFLICIVGDSDDDLEVLDRLFGYMAMNLRRTERVLAKLFKYDADKNGVAFHLGDLNDWVLRVSQASEAVVTTRRKSYGIDVQRRNFVTLPMGIKKDFAVREQSLKGHDTVAFALKADGSPTEPRGRFPICLKGRSRTVTTVVAAVGGSVLAGCIIYQVVKYLSK